MTRTRRLLLLAPLLVAACVRAQNTSGHTCTLAGTHAVWVPWWRVRLPGVEPFPIQVEGYSYSVLLPSAQAYTIRYCDGVTVLPPRIVPPG